MRPRVAIASVLASALAFAGCVGDTDPATNVTSKTAQLNAHGRTNDGPASWWWEYSTSRSTLEANGGTEVCGSPPEADGRCGPAQGPSQQDVALSFKLTGLTPSTTYWFRACGQDVNDANPTCGRVLSFTTLAEYYVFHSKVGSFGTGAQQFNTPLGVAVAGDASGTPRLKVTDYGNRRLSTLALEPLQVLTTFTDSVFQPRWIARDHLDNVWITEWNAVVAMDTANTRIAGWGGFGPGDGQFFEAAGIAVQREASGPFTVRRIYVADRAADRVQKFDPTGGVIAQWGGLGNGPGQLNEPIGVAVRGNVYVADFGNDRIQVFSPSGAFIRQWPVTDPVGVAFDAAGNVFVASNFEVLKFTSAGALITRWGSRGSGNGQFDGAAGVAVDAAGDVYVADTENDRVQKFKKE
ncbi:MAG: hypothetical protein JW895_14480 [Thermoleophilaceae bacterium]|nr:hypothetical protein [Thermoleophilaceae bacterium]